MPETQTREPRSRCRHVHIDGTRCSSPALLCHDLCNSHLSQHNMAIIRRHHIPAIAPMIPIVSFFAEDYDDILVNIGRIVVACANGNLTCGDLRDMNAQMRTSTSTLRAMEQVRRLSATTQRDLARTSQPESKCHQQPATSN